MLIKFLFILLYINNQPFFIKILIEIQTVSTATEWPSSVVDKYKLNFLYKFLSLVTSAALEIL